MSNKAFDAFYNTLLKIFPTYKEVNSLAAQVEELAKSVERLTNVIIRQQTEINLLRELYKNDRNQSSKILQ